MHTVWSYGIDRPNNQVNKKWVPPNLESGSGGPGFEERKNGSKKTAEIKTARESSRANTHLKLTHSLNLLQLLLAAFDPVPCWRTAAVGNDCSSSTFPIVMVIAAMRVFVSLHSCCGLVRDSPSPCLSSRLFLLFPFCPFVCWRRERGEKRLFLVRN